MQQLYFFRKITTSKRNIFKIRQHSSCVSSTDSTLTPSFLIIWQVFLQNDLIRSRSRCWKFYRLPFLLLPRPPRPFGPFRGLHALRPRSCHRHVPKAHADNGEKAIPAPTSQPLPFVSTSDSAAKHEASAGNQPGLRGEGEKNQGNKDGQRTFSRAENGRRNSCSAAVTAAPRAGLILSAAACKDANREQARSCSPEHVAQPAGCGSQAELRVSGL